MPPTVLNIENLCKFYGKRKVLDDVSLSVNAGEVYGLIGPNGAGKTTMIKIIVGLVYANGGNVTVCGHSLKGEFTHAIANIGGIIENPEMYGYLTGRQNLELFAGLYSGITRERIDEVVRLVKMENRIDDLAGKYSLGMRQRLGIAQSLLHRPRLLILDEPTNGLDPAGIREMRKLLRQLALEEGVAVFISSHILSEMQQLCDRAAIIDRGKIIKIVDIMGGEGAGLLQADRSQHSYTAAVSDSAAAAKILRKMDITADSKNGTLSFSAPRDQVPKLLRALLGADIDVYEVKKQSADLEDDYISVTQNGSIV